MTDPSPASIRSPSGSSSLVAGASKIASMRAASVPERTWSAEARAPSTSATASTTSDLPAPVSPVSTVKPGARASRTDSTTARFSTVSSRRAMGSVSASVGQQRGLRAQQVVERGAAGRLDQAHRLGQGPHLDAVADPHRQVDLAVEADEGAVVRLPQGEVDLMVLAGDDAVQRRQVRGDRGDRPCSAGAGRGSSHRR